MKIEAYSVGEMRTNCYFLYFEDGLYVIDPGEDAEFLLEKISHSPVPLKGLIATHGHYDHIMAVGEIQMSYSVPFYIHNDDIFLVKRLRETAKKFAPYTVVIDPIKITKMDHLPADLGLSIESIPGHTPGSMYLSGNGEDSSERILLVGDTIFCEGIGRYDFSYSDKSLLKRSIETLLKFPEETVVYSGHGEETTIGEFTDWYQTFQGLWAY